MALSASGCGRSDRADLVAGDDWLARAQQQIAAREYHASENEQGLQAPNRAHNLRTYFETTGVRVHDRTAEGSPELLRLSLAAIGRGNAIAPAAAGAEVRAQQDRVEIQRPGLVEWYVNSPAGLEHGFDLEARPAGNGELIVDLALSGARASQLGDAVRIETESGRHLRYGNLVAYDADRRPVPARFEVVRRNAIRIAIDDAGAHYPVVIDPLLAADSDALLRSDQAEADFGTSVAGAGDMNGDGYGDLIVGARNYDAGQSNEGAAFVFLGSASEIADGVPEDAATQLEANQAGARFGRSVAGAGDVNGDGYADVIVGAPGYDAGQLDEGAAFVFMGSATGIADGNPSTAAAQLESNLVYPLFGESFGASVAGAGDVNHDGYGDVIVGAPNYEAGQTVEGAAFLFLGSASGVADGSPGTAAAQLESNQDSSQFGASVAGAGDVNGDGYADIIVGAPEYSAPEVDEGSVFLFHGGASGIADGNPTTASTALQFNVASARLGSSVAGAGDVNGDGYSDVVIGAPSYPLGSGFTGKAFVFHGGVSGVNPGTWTDLSYGSTEGFGASVAGLGDVNGDGYADVAVTDPGYDYSESPFFFDNAGAVTVFLGSASGISTAGKVFFSGLQESGGNGMVVAGAGDLNGDGYGDLAIGLPWFTATDLHEGGVFLLLGGISAGNGPFGASVIIDIFSVVQSGARLGTSVAAAGDVNGDGFADVIVSAPNFDAGTTDEGAAFVFHGSAAAIGSPFASNTSGFSPFNVSLQYADVDAATQLESNQAGSGFGGVAGGPIDNGVAGAGDVNGDGFADVIVGAYNYDAGQGAGEGAAFIFHGSASGISDGSPATAATQLEANVATVFFGAAATGAGDVNGDGYGDVAVSAPYYETGNPQEGAVFVFHGSASGVPDGHPGTAQTQLESNQTDPGFGSSGLAGAGDVNGDGYADLVVGAPGYDAPTTSEGAVFIFHGSAAGIPDGNPATAPTQLESNQEGGWLGWSVAGAGDVNGDGYADVIAGAPGYVSGQGFQEGAAFVFHGSSTGVPDGNPVTAPTQLESNQGSAFFGGSVAGAGDGNGDGYSDVIVGARSYDGAAGSNAGAAYVFEGGAGGVPDGNPLTADRAWEGGEVAAEFGASVAGTGDLNADGLADLIVGAPLTGTPAQSNADVGSAYVFLGEGQPSRPLPRQRRGNGSGIAVQPWGASLSTTSFVAELTASHPSGFGRVRAEFEACVSGVPLGHASCTKTNSGSWVNVGGATPAVVLSKSIIGLTANELYRWRARTQYAPRTGPIPTNPPHGPWRRLGGQSNEADIQLPEPGPVLALVSGIALVAALARVPTRRARNR